jgi:hypothetical protein
VRQAAVEVASVEVHISRRAPPEPSAWTGEAKTIAKITAANRPLCICGLLEMMAHLWPRLIGRALSRRLISRSTASWIKAVLSSPSARTAAIRSSVPAANFAPTRSGHRFPLTVGRLENNPVLLDGYHRAASFWRSAPENASISAYVPTFLATSQ